MFGIRKKLAEKYDPSIMGAIGFVVPFIVMGGAVAAVAAAAVGAGAALLFGAAAATGAVWGAGIVGAGAAALIGINIIPPIAYRWAYKQELKEHVRNGGSTEGHWYVPGIEDMKPGKPLPKNVAIIFNTPKGHTQTPPGPNNPPAPPAP